MATLWSIHELQQVTAAALAALPYQGADSKRVRDVPDLRTIRYYTTLGLLDRPTEMRGRTAFYERRHVLQLVCIKQLQAAGLPLTEVQRRLAGATTKELTKLADLPEEFWREAAVTPAPPTAPSREPFWGAAAAPAPAPVAARPIACVRLPVAAGVQLEFQGIAPEQLDAASAELATLTEQLARELQRLGLLPRE